MNNKKIIFMGTPEIAAEYLNSLIENTGGDNKELILKRVNEIKDINVDSFNLANKTWSMKYENE